MTKHTWTAAISAVLFVVCAAIIAMAPVPYVTWSPGSTVDLMSAPAGGPQPVNVTGAPTYPATGQLRLTTVSVTRVDAPLSLPEALLAYWMPSREVLPREAVYRPGQSADDVTRNEAKMMDTSQTKAVAAALRVAGVKIREAPMINSVATSGPSNGKLEPGDLVTAVDGVYTGTIEEVRRIITGHQVGDAVVFTVERDKAKHNVTVTTVASASRPNTPVVGIGLEIGYSFEPRVAFSIDPAIGGPSAGLMFGLTVYEKLTPGDLVAGRTVAGTGTLTGDGLVGPIGGIQEKIAGASRDGASIFLVPEANCDDIGVPPAGIRIVKVATLRDAARYLADLKDPTKAAQVPGCS